MEKERLYLRSRGYYGARVLQTIAEIIRNRGGEICRRAYEHGYIISNRSTDAEIVTVDFYRYIRFRLDGAEIYYQYDENPFFPDLLVKAPIAENPKYGRYGAEVNLMPYAYEHKTYTQAEIDEQAETLLYKLMAEPMSKRYIK